MQIVLSGNRVVAHGANCFLAMGGTVICEDTGKAYSNATIAEVDAIPADIDAVGYEYHAGVFVPCAPYGEGAGSLMVACVECGTPKRSKVTVDEDGGLHIPGNMTGGTHASQHAADGSDPITPAMIGAASNPNLLDNWYFADPIDQRGGYVVPPNTPYYTGDTIIGYTDKYIVPDFISTTGYPRITVDGVQYVVPLNTAVRGYAGAGYTIDRWQQMGNVSAETIVDGGIKANLLTANAGYKYAFYQTIENPELFVGKEVTISALVTDFGGENNYIKVSCRSSSGELRTIQTKITSTGIVSATGIVPDGTTILWAVPCLFTPNSVVSDYITVSAVKLELGSTQTLAHQDADGNWVLNDPPPDKGMELLKCCMSTADSADTYANNKVTPAAINAVNKAGDTMSGALKFADDSAFIMAHSGHILDIVNDNMALRFDGNQFTNNGTAKALRLYNVLNGATDTILHTGNLAHFGIAKVVTGTYVGTGTCGEANPNTLTFDFAPKFVLVYAADMGGLFGWPSGMGAASGDSYTMMAAFPAECSTFRNSATSVKNSFTWGDNSFAWAVNESQPKYQLNESGTTYYYLAIG